MQYLMVEETKADPGSRYEDIRVHYNEIFSTVYDAFAFVIELSDYIYSVARSYWAIEPA